MRDSPHAPISVLLLLRTVLLIPFSNLHSPLPPPAHTSFGTPSEESGIKWDKVYFGGKQHNSHILAQNPLSWLLRSTLGFNRTLLRDKTELDPWVVGEDQLKAVFKWSTRKEVPKLNREIP